MAHRAQIVHGLGDLKSTQQRRWCGGADLRGRDVGHAADLPILPDLDPRFTRHLAHDDKLLTVGERRLAVGQLAVCPSVVDLLIDDEASGNWRRRVPRQLVFVDE